MLYSSKLDNALQISNRSHHPKNSIKLSNTLHSALRSSHTNFSFMDFLQTNCKRKHLNALNVWTNQAKYDYATLMKFSLYPILTQHKIGREKCAAMTTAECSHDNNAQCPSEHPQPWKMAIFLIRPLSFAEKPPAPLPP